MTPSLASSVMGVRDASLDGLAGELPRGMVRRELIERACPARAAPAQVCEVVAAAGRSESSRGAAVPPERGGTHPWDEVVDVSLGEQPTLVARRHGDGAVPLVLSHCVALDHRMWEPLVACLPKDLDVVAYRVRNHGDDGTASFTFRECADDVAELADVLDLPKFHLAGISMGGVIAQEFGIRYGDRLAGLTLMATSGGGRATTSSRAEAGRREGLAAQLGRTLSRWFTPEFLEENGAWVRYTRRRILGWTVEGWSSAWTALGDRETLSRLPGVDVPTLCVAGDRDVAAPEDRMAPLVRALPRATLKTTPGPHLFPLEQPTELAELLLAHHRTLST